MKATIIIPCYNCASTLRRCMECVASQSFRDFEAIFVNDGSTDATQEILTSAAQSDNRIKVITQTNKGVSAARNAALDAARGEFVFFSDPDDVFSGELLAKGIALMEADDADYCAFAYREKHVGENSFHVVPLNIEKKFDSNEEVLNEYASRMLGYSIQHVKAWYRGESLFARRLQGSVSRCVFRRSIIEKHNVRFDERIPLYEDAMFNCEYMLYVNRMTFSEEPIFDYIHASGGAIESLRRSEAEMRNKLELLRKRKELDAKSGGKLLELFECSCVFSVLEMMMMILTRKVSIKTGICLLREYMRDDVVRESFARFPVSLRKPVLFVSVFFFRNFIMRVI